MRWRPPRCWLLRLHHAGSVERQWRPLLLLLYPLVRVLRLLRQHGFAPVVRRQPNHTRLMEGEIQPEAANEASAEENVVVGAEGERRHDEVPPREEVLCEE